MAKGQIHSVPTKHDAEVLLSYHDINWFRCVREVHGRLPYGGPEFGIHLYYLDAEGNDLAYYTPLIESLMIFKEPRERGSHIEVLDY